MLDNRVSLWDINIREIHIGNARYVLQKEPERGATCIVYPAMKQEQVGETVYEQRVLLKEFYPILKADKGGGIRRLEDGTLKVAEYIQASEEYKRSLQRFQNAYSSMLELANADEGAEFLPVPITLAEDNGTWYLVEAYDSGTPLSELFADTDSGFDIFFFGNVFCKCLRTVAKLHSRGYYHLDLKPQNVSYTSDGRIKLFDTDTFLKKDDLKNFPTLLMTEGYSAPELRMAESAPENIPYWIGPWTDVYSLTQFLCWYIYGRPLREDELEEQLNNMESVITKRFGPIPLLISPKGIYRLKDFIRRNLSSTLSRRSQAIMPDEMEIILRFLGYERGEPFDNFKESKEPVYGYGEELDDLQDALTDKVYNKAQAALTGSNKQEREALARYYATMHRLDYSDIVEVHCDNFENLLGKIKTFPLMVSHGILMERNPAPIRRTPMKNPYPEFPFLFLIFDEKEEDTLSRKEAEAMNRLMQIARGHVLIVGKYNRCLNRTEDFGWDISISTIDMDERRIEQELADIREMLEQDESFPKWSWKQIIGKCLLALGLFLAGNIMNGLANDVAKGYMYYDRISDTYVCSSWVMNTVAMLIHLLGSGVSMLGAVSGVYRIFDLVTPCGWRYFIRKYGALFVTTWAVLAALNVPHIFREFSWYQLCQIFGYGYWQFIEECVNMLSIPIGILFTIMVILWIYGILLKKMRVGIVLNIVHYTTLILAGVHILVQTVANPWELLTLCVLMWLINRVCERTLYPFT